MGAGIRYRLVRAATRSILNLYYRSIEAHGRSFIPKQGRTLFIANHQAGLVDGLLILNDNDQVVRTVIKHTLFDNPVIAFFANGLGMIPVHRKQDAAPGEAAAPVADRVRGTFDRAGRAFAAGESVLLFPEGKSHDGSFLLRLRSGAARMLLAAEAEHDFRLGLKWVPVSIDFERKELPGSRVLLHYHPPRGIAHLRELHARDPEAAIERLRADMEDYLREITINYDTWADRVFIERLTDAWLARTPTRKSGRPSRTHLLDRHNHMLKWKRIMENTQREDPQLWAALRDAVEKLYGSLNLTGLAPGQLFGARARLDAFKVLVRVFVWSPWIAFGVIAWWPPSALIRWVARRFSPSKDVIPSYQIVSAVVLYPLWLALGFTELVAKLGADVGTGLAILWLVAGFSVLTVSRRLRPQVKQILSLYRHRSVGAFVDGKRAEIDDICHQAARLWNRGLRRQILIEELKREELGAQADPKAVKAS